MSFGYQPPPPKTTDTGTIIGYLALIFFGIPILLCVIGGVALFGVASLSNGRGGAGAGGGGGGGWNFTTKGRAWQECIDMHKQHEQEAIAELRRVIDHYKPNPPNNTAIQNVLQRANVNDIKLRNKLAEVQRAHGRPPAEVLRQLQGHTELDDFLESATREIAAAEQAQQEQRLAKIRADQELREQQRRADQQARFANVNPPQYNPAPSNPPIYNPPPVFNPPPAFNNPPPPPPPPMPQPPANQPPPGFPVTDVAQLKPKDIVFVQVNDQWHPAFVQLKRGKLIQVRSTETGAVELVTIERLRVPSEPTARPDSNLPPALQVAKAPKKTDSHDAEEEDDALFIAKPSGDQAATTPEPAAVQPGTAITPAKPVAPAAEYRTWTNDTGEFTVDAELVSFEFDLVTLRRRDGKVLSLRIEKLSTADQAVIREKFP